MVFIFEVVVVLRLCFVKNFKIRDWNNCCLCSWFQLWPYLFNLLDRSNILLAFVDLCVCSLVSCITEYKK